MKPRLNPDDTTSHYVNLGDLFIFESSKDGKFLVAKKETSKISSKMFAGANFDVRRGGTLKIDIVQGNMIRK